MSVASANLLRIGDVAARSRVSVRSLRYYEQRGLLLSVRSGGHQRLFEPEAIERVHLIQQLLAAGLSTADIVELLPCIYSGSTTPEMVARLVAQRENIETRARELLSAAARLEGLIDDARHRLSSPEHVAASAGPFFPA